MKKILLVLTAVFSLLTACKDHGQAAAATEEISPNKIYLFYSNSCPHCHDAMEYLDRNYPDLKISLINVANRQGYEMLIKCAQKFNLGRQIGTPLFCMGNDYLMGWSPETANRFDALVKPFLK